VTSDPDPTPVPAAPQVPELETVLACVRHDAADGLLSAWGWSTVIDENVGDAVVDGPLFVALHEAAGMEGRFPVGNAGLLHVYGYLFSTVMTPYGYKSDRWNDGVLATRLGLAPEAFRLDTGGSGQRANGAGRRGEVRVPDTGGELPTPLARVTAAALPLLMSPPTAARVHDAQVGELRTRAVVIPSGEDTGVLVSGTDDGEGWRLITVFPIEDAAGFADHLAATPPHLRWNAAPRPR
jgi:hypothetical protein